MTDKRVFTSWLAPYFDRFVALRQASGSVYVDQRRMLLAFDRYIAEQSPHPPLDRDTLDRYVTSSLDRLSPRAYDNVTGVVWPALTYAQRHGASVEEYPERPPKSPRYWRQRQPRILTSMEMRTLLAAARRLPSEGHRSARVETMLGLLYTTGLRIGEALSLDIGDLDCRSSLLTVRRGKFGKSRVLPLRASTTRALVRYVNHSLRPAGTMPADPLFVSCRRQRLSPQTVRPDIYKVCLVSGISKPWPRPHDFRHTFAISRVQAWYEQGRDVNLLLPALSTYLGHVSVEHTRKYLIANGSLLEYAVTLFEQQTTALDEVLS